MARFVLREGGVYRIDEDGSEHLLPRDPPREMTDAEVEAAALSDPDNQPLTEADFARMKRKRVRADR